jgi:hypothetical protein
MLRAVGADRVPRGALRAPPCRLGRNRGRCCHIPAPWPTGSSPQTLRDAARDPRCWARRLSDKAAG